MKSFILLAAIVSLWITVTATPQGYVEGIIRLNGQIPDTGDTDEYDESELPNEFSRQNKLTDRENKGKLS